MTWWCAATNQPWSWEWRAYPGVWLVMLALLALYLVGRRRAVRAAGPGRWGHGRTATFVCGWLLVWVALDWPVGALGAGYLASLHAVQWLLLAQITMPFLILGVPPGAWERLAQRSPRWGAFLGWAAGPLIGLVTFNVILLVTHVPAVADSLMASQLGAFVVDVSWLASGFALWWPVLAPPSLARMSEPAKLAYLFGATIIPTVPAAFLTFADHPAYRLYELAPRVHGITAHSDQQTAGLIMKGVADPVLWLAMALVFFRWSALEKAADAREAAARSALLPGTGRG
jgi:putative membrane protein